MLDADTFIARLRAAVRKEIDDSELPSDAQYGTTEEAFLHLITLAHTRKLAPYGTGNGRRLLANDKNDLRLGRIKDRRMQTRLTACPEFDTIYGLPGFWSWHQKDS